MLGTDWLAGPAVAFGSAVNEVDWASTVVDSAICAWHGLVLSARRTRDVVDMLATDKMSVVQNRMPLTKRAICAWHGLLIGSGWLSEKFAASPARR